MMVLDEKDIGLMEDLFELLKNLTSLETHSLNTYESTKDKKWMDFYKMVKKDRSKILSIVTKKKEGEIWCINKHSCEVSMRAQECSSRFLFSNQIEEMEFFSDLSKRYYYSFMMLNGYSKSDEKVRSSA